MKIEVEQDDENMEMNEIRCKIWNSKYSLIGGEKNYLPPIR
jgi:hypothetical protein